MPRTNSKLSPKEAKFCKEYITDFNGARSARAAGYSEKAAREIAYELLTRPHVRLKISEHLKSIDAKYTLEASELISFLIKAMMFDPTLYMDKDGYIDMDKLPPDVGKLITGISTNTHYNKEGPSTTQRVEWFKKEKALEILAKYKGLLTDRVELTGAGGAPLPGITVSLPPGTFKK